MLGITACFRESTEQILALFILKININVNYLYNINMNTLVIHIKNK